MNRALALATASALASLVGGHAFAQSTFLSANADATATADNNWNNAANWDTAAVPNGSTARASVPQGVTAFNLRLLTSPITVNQITFQNVATTPLGVTLNNGAGGSLSFAVDATVPEAPVGPLLANALGSSTQTADNVISAPVTLGGTLTVQQDHTFAQLNLTGAVNDGGSGLGVVKKGAGVLQLGGNATINSYTGDTIVNAGVLRIQSPNSLPGGVLAGASTGSNLVLNGGVAGVTGQASLFSRDLGAGPGQVRFTGNGGFAGYGGARTVNLGGASATLVWDSTPFFLSSGQNLILGSTAANNSVDFQNPIDFNGAARTVNTPNGTGTTGDGKLSGVLSNGGLIKSGNGNLDLIGPSPNTYTGTTQVNAGILRLGKTPGVNAIAGDVTIGNAAGGNDVLALLADHQINDTSVLTFAGAVGSGTAGIFRLNDHVETVGGIVSPPNVGIVENNTANPATLTVNNAGDQSFGGQLRNGATSIGPLSFVKEGAGTLTLTGTNPNLHTGTTTVRGGTLKLETGTTLDSTPLVNVSGGTLDVSALPGGLPLNNGRTLAGTGRIVGGVAVQAGGVVSPGDPTALNTVGTLKAGDVSLAGGSKLVIEFGDAAGSPGVGWDALEVSGSISVSADGVTPVTISLVSNDPVAGGLGAPYGFDARVAGSWILAGSASSSPLFSGAVDAAQFTVDPSQWAGGGDAAGWSVTIASEALVLNYTPATVPEPAAGAIGLGIAAGMARRRRRQRA